MTRPEFRPGRRRSVFPEVRPLSERIVLALRAFHTGLTPDRLAFTVGADVTDVRSALSALLDAGMVRTRQGWPDVYTTAYPDPAEEN